MIQRRYIIAAYLFLQWFSTGGVCKRSVTENIYPARGRDCDKSVFLLKKPPTTVETVSVSCLWLWVCFT